MKLRFEPTLVLQTVSALLAFIVTFGFSWLSTDQAGAIVAVIAAVIGAINALKVHPVAPAVFQAVITTGAALLTSYGLDLSQQQVGAFQLLVIAMVALVTNQQTTSKAELSAKGE